MREKEKHDCSMLVHEELVNTIVVALGLKKREAELLRKIADARGDVLMHKKAMLFAEQEKLRGMEGGSDSTGGLSELLQKELAIVETELAALPHSRRASHQPANPRLTLAPP